MMFTWQGGCSRLEAERGKAAGTVKSGRMSKGFWLSKHKFNLALLMGHKAKYWKFFRTLADESHVLK